MVEHGYEEKIEDENGNVFDLAFIYDDVIYYFSHEAVLEESCSAAIVEGKSVFGIEANEMLADAIEKYKNQGGDVWIATWFRGHVSAFLR